MSSREGARSSTKTSIIAFTILILLAIILVPAEEARTGGASSYVASGFGVLGFYETARRLGWETERSEEPLRGNLDSSATYVVIEPSVSLTGSEVHAVLTAVRAGGGLLLAPGAARVMLDSLGLARKVRTFSLAANFRTRGAPPMRPPLPDDSTTGADSVDTYDVQALQDLFTAVLQRRDSTQADTVVFLSEARTGSSDEPLPLILGMSVGRGRVAILADGLLLRNEYFRVRRASLLSIRVLEWVTHNRQSPLIFAEYLHGAGHHPDILRTIHGALWGTRPGRVALQLAVGGLVFLLATGIRPIPPRTIARAERRSATEHVDALASAFELSGATRLTTRRLLRGLRRRRAAGAPRGLSDDDYLEWAGARSPDGPHDAELVARALREPQTPQELVDVGEALHRIERTVSQ